MDLWLSFVAGMFGSLHCVGMCGPIVLAYLTQRRAAQTEGSPGTLTALPMHLL